MQFDQHELGVEFVRVNPFFAFLSTFYIFILFDLKYFGICFLLFDEYESFNKLLA